ncbi:MAG: alpha/beta hydrolase [Actinomyces graevenitzii]|nr:alpha/beta hydrolase [Actinomyces graevenitzii]
MELDMPNTPGEPHLNSQDSQLGDGDYPMVLSCTIVDRAANPKGTIVAFHGVSDNGASLADIGARWGEQWRVVLVDSLGHGLSPRFSPQQLQAPFQSALQAAAETVRVEASQSIGGQVVLFGHSMGGAIAAGVARDHPQLVRAVVLEDPALLTPTQEATYKNNAGESVGGLEHISRDQSGAIANLLLAQPAYRNWPLSEYGPWAQAKTQVDRDFIATGVVGLAGREIIKELQVPTLVLTGDGPDVLLGQAGLEKLAAYANPHLHTALISGATHCVRRDKSEKFQQAVNSFLAALPKPAPAPYIAPEIASLVEGIPPQTTWQVQALRERGDKLLGAQAPLEAGHLVEVTQLPVKAGAQSSTAIELRILSRKGRSPRCVVVSLHGGGYVCGRARFDDARNLELADLLDAVVLSPNYTLAPEAKYPHAAAQCEAVLERAATYGVPVFIYGDSAGAGLGYQTLARLIQAQKPLGVSGFIALEPCLDPRLKTASYNQYSRGPVWTKTAATHAWHHYAPDTPSFTPYPCARALAKKMPPVIVFINPADPLRDEGQTWAFELVDGGAQVELHMPPGTVHGLLSAPNTKTWLQVQALIKNFVTQLTQNS